MEEDRQMRYCSYLVQLDRVRFGVSWVRSNGPVCVWVWLGLVETDLILVGFSQVRLGLGQFGLSPNHM